MSTKAYTKKDFLKLLLSNADDISDNDETIKSYAQDEGIDIEGVRSEGKKRLKRLMLKLNAEKTQAEMISNRSLKEMALDLVEKLMSQADFSFQNYVQQQQIPVHSRNLKEFSPEDVKNTLVQYHYLKFLETKRNDSK